MGRGGGSDGPVEASAGGYDVVDQYGRPVDQYGRPVDQYGRPLDEYGRPLDQYGRPLDEYGRPLDQFGRPIADGFETWEQPEAAQAADGGATRRRRRGLHIGPLAITPTRVTLLIALIGSSAFLGYAVTVRDTSQIPMLASGSAVLGMVFAALALSGARGAIRAGSEGAGGRAFAMALGGGIASVIAFGCFGAAIVLALVWRP